MKILILDAHSNASLSVLQSLGRAGYRTYLAGTTDKVTSWHSRYAVDRFIYPDPLAVRDQFKAWLLKVQARHNFDFILPITDNTIYPLIELQQEKWADKKLVVPSSESFSFLFNKEKTISLASSLGVPVPKTTKIASGNMNFEQFKEFPLFVKPTCSKRWLGQEGRHLEPKLVENLEELAFVANDYLEYGDLLIQQYVPGCGVGIDVLCNQGDIILSFAHKRLHEYPLTGGGSTYRVSIPMPENLFEASKKMMAKIKYHGVAMIEFKQKDDNYWLMEINGRFWGSLPLAAFAGIDFPKALIEMLTEAHLSVQDNYKIGFFSRKVSSDVMWFKANLKANKLNRFLLTDNIMRSFFEWFRIFSLKECWDNALWQDPMPILFEIKEIICKEINNIIRRVYKMLILRQAKQKTLRFLKKKTPQKLLILCYGNICRSPFVAKYLKARLEKESCIIRSSGFHPIMGRKTPEIICNAAKARGVDLTSHESTVIDHDLIKWADGIVIMDYENWQLLREYEKSMLHKVIWLGAMMDGAVSIEIADPYGKIKKDIESIFDNLEMATQKFSEILNEVSGDEGNP